MLPSLEKLSLRGAGTTPRGANTGGFFELSKDDVVILDLEVDENGLPLRDEFDEPKRSQRRRLRDNVVVDAEGKPIKGEDGKDQIAERPHRIRDNEIEEYVITNPEGEDVYFDIITSSKPDHHIMSFRVESVEPYNDGTTRYRYFSPRKLWEWVKDKNTIPGAPGQPVWKEDWWALHYTYDPNGPIPDFVKTLKTCEEYKQVQAFLNSMTMQSRANQQADARQRTRLENESSGGDRAAGRRLGARSLRRVGQTGGPRAEPEPLERSGQREYNFMGYTNNDAAVSRMHEWWYANGETGQGDERTHRSIYLRFFLNGSMSAAEINHKRRAVKRYFEDWLNVALPLHTVDKNYHVRVFISQKLYNYTTRTIETPTNDTDSRGALVWTTGPYEPVLEVRIQYIMAYSLEVGQFLQTSILTRVTMLDDLLKTAFSRFSHRQIMDMFEAIFNSGPIEINTRELWRVYQEGSDFEVAMRSFDYNNSLPGVSLDMTREELRGWLQWWMRRTNPTRSISYENDAPDADGPRADLTVPAREWEHSIPNDPMPAPIPVNQSRDEEPEMHDAPSFRSLVPDHDQPSEPFTYGWNNAPDDPDEPEFNNPRYGWDESGEDVPRYVDL